MDPAWITIECAYVLRGAVFVAALRNGNIVAYNADNPSHWTVIPPDLWRDMIFPGEPGYATNEGEPNEGVLRVTPHRWVKWHPLVRRADVEALPKNSPDVTPPQTPESIKAKAVADLIARSKEEQTRGRLLKRNDAWSVCRDMDMTWRDFLVLWADKALEPYKNRRGRRSRS